MTGNLFQVLGQCLSGSSDYELLGPFGLSAKAFGTPALFACNPKHIVPLK